MGTACLPRSQQKTATEWSLAVRKENPRLGVGNAFADSTDPRLLNPPSELSLASTLAAMKWLFMDSDGSRVSPFFRLHLCSFSLNGVIGTFASTRRAGRECTVRHARHRMAGFTRVTGLERGQPPSLQYAWKRSPCVRLQPPSAVFSDWNAPGHRSTRCCRPDRRGVVSRPVWTAQKDSLLGSKQGDPWVPGTSQGPMGFHGKGDLAVPGRRPQGSAARASRVSCRARTQQGLPPRECAATRRWTDSPWFVPGTVAFSRQDDMAAPGLRPQGVAVQPSEVSVPARLDRTNRTLLQGVPWQQTGTHGFLDKGGVMIRRPCLAAWSTGSDWRTHRPID